MILILDYGSQSTHLISRRLKELSISSVIIEPEQMNQVYFEKAAGIILSGGPQSVYDVKSPTIAQSFLSGKKPILGICYGQQLLAHRLGGKVTPGKKKEFGPATITIKNHIGIFNSTAISSASFTVWMSHGDEVTSLPKGYISIAKTETIPHAAFQHKSKNIFGIQFHPELIHTQFGLEILKNFSEICGLKTKKKAIDEEFIDNVVTHIKESVGKAKAIAAFSGGVDSTIASLLVHQAIGENLTPIYVDSGLMREGETEALQKIFLSHYRMNVQIVDAQKIFMKNLKGVIDPEQKRKVIGKTFIDVLQKEARRQRATFLVQGTIYPDVIESSGTKHSDKIKSHHNVGGLPDSLHLTLLEPLRNLYKDEVRAISTLLKLPEAITHRQPFPGPGLAIRIIGEVTEQKLEILRKADSIVQEEIGKSGLTNKIWQAFAIFAGIKTTGVRGDNRAYGETIAIRAINAHDTMSATWAHLPHTILETISNRITNEITAVNRVVYDITNKPPATMEWE